MTFGGPSAVYKLNYSRYYFRRCFYRYYFSPYTAHINLAITAYINPATTARINPATTIRINPAAAYYRPAYYKAARL